MPVISTIAAATARAFGAFKSAAGGAADEFFKYVTLLLHGDGTNGAQNNTFLDSSTNNFTITRNGNTTQGTFSPFSQTGWSNYFDGSGDYLDSAPGAIGTGDFTLECWVYFNSLASDQGILDTRGNSNTSGFALLGRSTGQISMADGTSLIGTAASASANTWIHVAASRASGVISFYVNGTRSGSTVANTTNFSNNRLRIGAIGSASENLAGYVSNVRLLTSAIYSGTTITVPTTPLTAISGTSLLTCQSNRFRDASTNNFAITVNGNTSVQAFSPFAPTAAYSAATVGGSGYFDGSGDYLTAPSNTAFQIGTGDFTVEFWMYPLSLGTGGVATQQIVFVTGSSGGFACSVWDGNMGVGYSDISNLTSAASSSIKNNCWVHLAFCRQGTTLRLFANGVLAGSVSDSTNFSSSNSPAVGAYYNGLVPFYGWLSGFRYVKGTAVYTAAFTPPTSPPIAVANTQLLTNFTNGGIIDNTAKNVLETVGNAQISTSVKKFGTGSLAFDGTGDYLKGVGNNPNLNFGSGDFTIEFWMYTADVTPSVAAWFVAMFNSSSGQNSWGVRLETSGALVMYLSSDGGESPTTISAASPALSNSTWHHIAVVRNGSGSNNITIYVDGVSKATGTFSSALFNSNQPVTVGIQGNTGFNQYFNGYIDDLRITKGVARYTTTFTPPTAAFADQ